LDLGHKACRLAQHVGGERHVEHRPAGGGADLGGHGLNEILRPRFEHVGGLEKDFPPRARGRFRPFGESGGGGIGGPLRVLDGGGGGAGGDIAGNGIAPFKDSAAGGFLILIGNEQAELVHLLNLLV